MAISLFGLSPAVTILIVGAVVILVVYISIVIKRVVSSIPDEALEDQTVEIYDINELVKEEIGTKDFTVFMKVDKRTYSQNCIIIPTEVTLKDGTVKNLSYVMKYAVANKFSPWQDPEYKLVSTKIM